VKARESKPGKMQDVKEPQGELTQTLANAESINRDLQRQIQKRKAIEKKLMKIQRLYDTMVHNFPDGVIGVLNREMQYVLIDGKDLDQIEIPALGLSGHRAGQNTAVPIGDDTVEKLKRAFEGEHVSCEVRTKDRIYHVTAVPLTDSKNNINEILCVMQNVTARKLMEEGLVKALEKEKELGELKSRFVTMASHEFRTPLTTILSSTFLLENYSGQNYDKEKTVHVNRIKRSVNNLTMILNEFLSLEKLEEDKVKVVYTDINVPDYIHDLISEMEVVKKDSQSIEYHHYGKQSMARLDHQLFWSIVTNLVSNAFKYSRAGGQIMVTSKIKDNCVILTVKDNGIGIPPPDQKYIFGRFYRASNATNFEGTGLGLHIVQKYVHLLKGHIHFESQLEVGTTFTVELSCGDSVVSQQEQFNSNNIFL
jgi:K+-sensing histidine kinase KdpD